MPEKTIPNIQQEASTEVSREVTRTPERYVQPLVDIYETKDGLTVVADMPGVPKENLNIKVENDILTIEGHMTKPDRELNFEREFEFVSFFRQFELSEAVDREKIAASIVNGVLTVNLPKTESQKPRQITVRVS
ncbi:MAG: Hsp20/alpha crystallin family protein [Candidatus Riflebacteria bacterium]|nr:Hsp20/alpha crystallin family protein [Candidatus Riflebacteria bacterium]